MKITAKESSNNRKNVSKLFYEQELQAALGEGKEYINTLYKFPEETNAYKLHEFFVNNSGETTINNSFVTVIQLINLSCAGIVRTPLRDSKTGLYLCSLAPTGTGKQIQAVTPASIMRTFDTKQGMSSSLHSETGLINNTLLKNPDQCIIQDEFDLWMDSTLHDKGKASLKSIILKLHSHNSDDFVNTASYADMNTEVQEIKHPGFSIFGIGTIDGFRSKLKYEDISSGLLNRFIFIVNPDNVEILQGDNKNLIDSPEIKYVNTNLLNLHGTNVKVEIKFSKEASQILEIVKNDIQDLIEDDLSLTDISKRFKENTIRLATQLTAFEGLTEIPGHYIMWAYNIVKTSGLWIYYNVGKKVDFKGKYKIDDIKILEYLQPEPKFISELTSSGPKFLRVKKPKLKSILDPFIANNDITCIGLELEKGTYNDLSLTEKDAIKIIVGSAYNDLVEQNKLDVYEGSTFDLFSKALEAKEGIKSVSLKSEIPIKRSRDVLIVFYNKLVEREDIVEAETIKVFKKSAYEAIKEKQQHKFIDWNYLESEIQEENQKVLDALEKIALGG